jgi:hypothetical protein
MVETAFSRTVKDVSIAVLMACMICLRDTAIPRVTCWGVSVFIFNSCAGLGVSKLPPSCKLPNGTVFTLDPAWRQGLADVPAGDNRVFGTNVDILDVIEGNSPRPGNHVDDVESGDEASCPAMAAHSSEGDSEDEDDALPEDVKTLLRSDKRQLALYAVHLEQHVVQLTKVWWSTECMSSLPAVLSLSASGLLDLLDWLGPLYLALAQLLHLPRHPALLWSCFTHLACSAES